MRAETRRTLLRAGTGLVLFAVVAVIAVVVTRPESRGPDTSRTSTPGVAWRFATLDGEGGPAGRVDADVGRDNAAVVFGGFPHVFHHDATDGDLRHAWWTGDRWAFETLDGAGGPDGRVDADVGEHAAVAVFGSGPHVWYWNATAGDLRHAWWTGDRWAFETLDGAGGPDGRVDADVGEDPSAVLFGPGGGFPHVFYRDFTAGTLRHAWWTGSRWAFETLDGAGGPDGRVDADVGRFTTALVYGSGPHVWYWNVTGGDLRHAWWTGDRWAFETLNGIGGTDGRIDADVGWDNAAVLFNGVPHVFTRDADVGNLRHAWWTGSRWAFETLDGAGGPDGRVDADVGMFNAAVVSGGSPRVFYWDAETGDLRHAWYD